MLVRSNAAALEWLSSPIVYRRHEGIAAELAGLARIAAHRPALEYHYDRLARGAWPSADGAPARLKALFYALRPALALTWLRRVGAPPPMDLPSLMAGLAPPPGSAAAIAALRACKAAGTEADPAPPCPEAEAFVAEVPAVRPKRPSPWDKAPAIAAADALLSRVVMPRS